MNTPWNRTALWLAGLAVATAAWACSATRGGDGTITISFAPDMTITAKGLEDALDKLIDLLDACRSGNFTRPCTQGERDDIVDTIDRVIEAKERLHHPRPPTPVGG